jgi:hypothetical protein
MDGEHGPFDIPIVDMVDECEDAGADGPSLTGFTGDGDANAKWLLSLTSGASRELVFDPLIARIQLELFGRGLPQRPRGSVGSHNFGSRIVAAWMLEEGKTGPRTTHTSRPEAHVWNDQ